MCRDEHRQLEAQLDAKRIQLNHMCGTRNHAHAGAPTQAHARSTSAGSSTGGSVLDVAWCASRVSCTTARGGALDRRFNKLMRANQDAATLYNELQNTRLQFFNRVLGPLIMEVRRQHATDTVQHATWNGQYATDNMQQITCNRQRATDNVQKTTRSRHHAADTMQLTTRSRQHAADHMHQTPCSR